MYSVLVVDDEVQLTNIFQRILTKEGYTVQVVTSGEEALDAVKTQIPDLVIMDVRLPGMDGLETFRAIKDIEPRLPVIVITGHGSTEIAIEATRLGAFDYVLKPFDIYKHLPMIKQAVESGTLMRSPVEMDASPQTAVKDAIIGNSGAMQEIYKTIGRCAPTDATILIRGESGSGKELVARALYQYSSRADQPFLVINCVAIPETLLESELFGYEKGSFTGATNRRIGKIEQANGGTVFLDEIGDMPLSIQAKILRLLQEKTLERLGGRETVPVDVRIIAATNCNLEDYMAAGKFRGDLYYRLKVITVNLPPLRERLSDIPLLCDYFLPRFAKKIGIKKYEITPEAKTLLQNYSWPGNVRELANTLQKALILSHGYPIRPEHILGDMIALKGKETLEAPPPDAALREWVKNNLLQNEHEDVLSYFIDHLTKIIIEEVFGLTKQNLTRAAQILGISRPTLRDKLAKYKIKDSHSDEEE